MYPSAKIQWTTADGGAYNSYAGMHSESTVRVTLALSDLGNATRIRFRVIPCTSGDTGSCMESMANTTDDVVIPPSPPVPPPVYTQLPKPTARLSAAQPSDRRLKNFDVIWQRSDMYPSAMIQFATTGVFSGSSVFDRSNVHIANVSIGDARRIRFKVIPYTAAGVAMADMSNVTDDLDLSPRYTVARAPLGGYNLCVDSHETWGRAEVRGTFNTGNTGTPFTYENHLDTLTNCLYIPARVVPDNATRCTISQVVVRNAASGQGIEINGDPAVDFCPPLTADPTVPPTDPVTPPLDLKYAVVPHFWVNTRTNGYRLCVVGSGVGSATHVTYQRSGFEPPERVPLQTVPQQPRIKCADADTDTCEMHGVHVDQGVPANKHEVRRLEGHNCPGMPHTHMAAIGKGDGANARLRLLGGEAYWTHVSVSGACHDGDSNVPIEFSQQSVPLNMAEAIIPLPDRFLTTCRVTEGVLSREQAVPASSSFMTLPSAFDPAWVQN